MPQTYGEKINYTRGYNRGVAKMRGHAEAAIRLAKSYRRLTRRPVDLRRCDGCDRWARGCKSCHWGTCRGGFDWDVEALAWVDQPTGQARQEIITHENFGCVNWIPKS